MLALVAATVLNLAASAAQPPADERPVLRITIYGRDPCPRSTDEQVVVCARRPESERHRIPPALRERPEDAEQSWAERAESLEMVGRTGPQSCSTVGPGGFTGCWEEMIREARRERAQARRQAEPR
jgi:hypothetical protein